MHTQRLLREPPFELVAGALDTEMARLSPDAALTEVTRFFASYNLVCAPVVDDEDHLLGAVTVDDVLDHLLPDNWRDEGLRRPGRSDAVNGGQHHPAVAPAPHSVGDQPEVAMADTRARRRLDQPRSGRRFSFDIDPETFGRFSESLARFMGTGTFLFWQTLLVIIWITVEPGRRSATGWDPYPFILLNLAFSTQAAYAAPLILLAQNRQDDRDRITLEEDRNRAAQTKADTEFLARELAALRVAIGEVATRDYLRGELDRLRGDLEEIVNPGCAPTRRQSAHRTRRQEPAKSCPPKPPTRRPDRRIPAGVRRPTRIRRRIRDRPAGVKETCPPCRTFCC